MHQLWLKIWLRWTRKLHPDLEHFSDESKACFARANKIACQHGSTHLNSIHLLLAIMETPLLASLEASEEISLALAAKIKTQTTDHSEPVKKAVEFAIAEARKLDLKEITPALLLYGVIQIDRTEGAKTLKSYGLTTETIAELIPLN